MVEFKTRQYPDTASGQRQKVADLSQWTAAGWTVVSETVTPGVSRGGCCMPGCCGPMYIAGKATPGTITVTLQRDSDAAPGSINPEAAPQHPALRAHQARVESVSRTAHLLTQIFLATPRPDAPIKEPAFQLGPMPEEPALEDPGLLGMIDSGYRRKVEAGNEVVLRAYRAVCANREKTRDRLTATRRRWRRDLAEGRFDDVAAMHRVLRYQLANIEWPVPVIIEAANLERGGIEAQVDLVLPVDTCVPDEWPYQAGRGVDIQSLSDEQHRAAYAKLIHRIGLRVAGESFRALPNLEDLTLSAYADCLDPATGGTRSECLYSARVRRDEWLNINFEELAKIDPIACLDRLNSQKEMSQSYEFSPVAALLPRSNRGGQISGELAPVEAEPSDPVLVACPECARPVSNLASACPDCGYPIPRLDTYQGDRLDSEAQGDDTTTAQSERRAEEVRNRQDVVDSTEVKASAVLLLLACAPIGVLLVWCIRSWTVRTRAILSGVGLLCFALLMIMLNFASRPSESSRSGTRVSDPPVSATQIEVRRTVAQQQILEFERVTRRVFGLAESRRREMAELVSNAKWAELRTTARIMKSELSEGKRQILSVKVPGRLRETRTAFLNAADNYIRYATVMSSGREIILGNGGFEEFNVSIARPIRDGIYNITMGLTTLATVEVDSGLVSNDILDPDVVTGTWRWWGIDSFGEL